MMRHERCSDDESDSYPRIGYQHFIDSSRACLALESGICLAVPLLGGNQPEIAHELARVRKAPEVADLVRQTNRRDCGDTTQCLQRFNHRLETPVSIR